MNRYPILTAILIALLAACTRTASHSGPKLAFVAGDSIMLGDISGEKATCFAKGTNPALSPDGLWLAYTKTTGENRSVVVKNTEDGGEWNVPCRKEQQQFGAAWSPDGRWLAWNQYIGTWWEVAAMPVSSRKVIVVSRSLKRSVFSPAWSKSLMICFHDLETIYLADTTGKITRKQQISSLPGSPVISSATVFIPVKGFNELVCNAATDDEGFDAPADALFRITQNPAGIKRLTPAGLNCGRPVMNSDGSLVFEASRTSSPEPTIFLYKHGKLAEIGQGREPAMSK